MFFRMPMLGELHEKAISIGAALKVLNEMKSAKALGGFGRFPSGAFKER